MSLQSSISCLMSRFFFFFVKEVLIKETIRVIFIFTMNKIHRSSSLHIFILRIPMNERKTEEGTWVFFLVKIKKKS